MKQTAIQQAIAMVRNRMESQNETLMGKHTAHHLQQIERGLYDLLEKEKEQIIKSHIDAFDNIVVDFKKQEFAEQYYNETYK